MALALKLLVGILAATSATLLYFLVHEFNPFLRRCNPDVCQSYALSAFKAHSVMHRGAGQCEFGLLPGFLTFNVMNPPGSRWQTAVSSCQLRNRLMPSAATGNVKVLLLGDSVDARLAKEWCIALQQPLRFTPAGITGLVASFAANIAAKATGSSSNSSGDLTNPDDCCKDRDVFYYCKPANETSGGGDGGSIGVGMYHLLGVHLDGPYHTGAKGNFLTRIPLALKAFNATFGGPPDLVMLHSNFWDQSRMWEQGHPGYGSLNKLMPEVVFSWSSNFSLLLSTTTEYLPAGTLIATRTAAFPAFTANWLGRWQYIHQLNMAAIEVTRLHGHSVVDLGGMLFGLEPRQYLDDTHHPNKIVLLECANIAMNLLYQQQHRGEAAAEQFNAISSSGSSSSSDLLSQSLVDSTTTTSNSSSKSSSDSQPTSGTVTTTTTSSSTTSSSSSSEVDSQPTNGTAIATATGSSRRSSSATTEHNKSSSADNKANPESSRVTSSSSSSSSEDAAQPSQSDEVASGGGDAVTKGGQQPADTETEQQQQQQQLPLAQSPPVTAQAGVREQQHMGDQKQIG